MDKNTTHKEPTGRTMKSYRSKNGKLVEEEYKPPTQNEHRKHLREAECESDIFTARTPEELHAIADAELVEMTKTTPTRHGRLLLLSWIAFRKEMMCRHINSNPWIKYRYRDASDDLVKRGYSNISLQEKVQAVLKKALFKSLKAGGEIEGWSLEELIEKHKQDWRPLAHTNDAAAQTLMEITDKIAEASEKIDGVSGKIDGVSGLVSKGLKLNERTHDRVARVAKRVHASVHTPVSAKAQSQALGFWKTWETTRLGTEYAKGKATKLGCYECHEKKLKELGIQDVKVFIRVLDARRKQTY